MPAYFIFRPARFFMTIKNPTRTDFWRPCKANSLTSAKREATNILSEGYLDDRIVVGWSYDGTLDQIIPIAQKENYPASKWQDWVA